MNLHQEFVSLNFQIIGMKNRLMFLLLEIYEQEIYKKHGCSTIYEYAFKYAKLSKERVQKALRTLKNTENTPEVRAKIATCGLDKVALVAKLATPENQHIYAEHIENMSTPALQAFTKEIRQGKPEAPKMMIELDEEMQIIFNQLKKTQGPNLSNQQALRGILKSVSEDVFSKTSQSNTTEKPPASSGESDAHPLPTIPSGSITSLSLQTDLAKPPKFPPAPFPPASNEQFTKKPTANAPTRTAQNPSKTTTTQRHFPSTSATKA